MEMGEAGLWEGGKGRGGLEEERLGELRVREEPGRFEGRGEDDVP